MRVMYRTLSPANSYSLFGHFDPVPRMTLMMRFHSISGAITFICVHRFGAVNPVVMFANAGKGHIADKEHSAGLVDCSIYTF